MSISSTNRKAGPFTGNGTASSFPFYFKVFEAADLQVVLLDIATSLETTLTITANYTVSLNANQDATPGGTVTLTAGALASGYKLTITSNIGNLQPTNLTNQGGFYPDVVEDALDRATIQIQQMSETLGRAVTIPISSTASTALPYPQGGTVIGWDDTGSSLINLSPEDIASQQLYANWKYDTFTGDGTTTQFTLQSNPGNIANMDVSVSGVTQLPGTDYTLSGTTIAFTTAPALGLPILVRYGQATVQTNVTYSQEVFNVTSGTVDGTGKQTIFNLTSSYSPGNNGISVYLNGSRLVGGTDYTETTTTRITLSKGAYPGDVVLIITAEPINANAVDSAQISYTPAGTNAVATNVQAKLRETVSVKDFGAVGDGVTDDTAAIQAAIDAVDIGGTVYLFGGVFKTTGEILITKTISIVGEDCRLGNIVNPFLSKSCIYASSVTDGTAINVQGCVATFRNFCIYNNGGAVIVDGIRSSQPNNSIKVYDMLIEGFHTGIRCTEGFYNNIQNTSIAFCDTGVRIDYCYNFYISALKVRANNTPVYDTGTYGVRLLNGSSVNMFGGAIENFATVAVDLSDSSTSINLNGVYFESSGISPTSEIVSLGTNSSVSAIGCHAYLTFSERFITVDSGSSTGVRVFSRNNRLVYPTDSTVTNVYVGLTGDSTAYWDVAGDPWDGTVGSNVEYWTGAVLGGTGNYNVQYPINHPDFLLSRQTAGFHLTPAATTPTIPVSGTVSSGNDPTMFSFANSGFAGDDPMGIHPNYGYNAYLAVKQKNQWEKVGIRLPDQPNSTATTVAGIVTDFNALLTKLRNNGVMI